MILYDTAFSPPAPVVDLMVQNADEPTRQIGVRMQIDTAADLTLIPESAVSALNLTPEGDTPIADYRGVIEMHPVYHIIMRIDRYVIHVPRVATIADQTGILGRDILRGFTLTLRGKDQTFDIVDP